MTLEALSAAAEARRTAEQDYRSAVLAASRQHSPREIAEAAGVSRQAVYQLLARIRDETADFDARYSRVVTHYASGYTLKDGAAITASRNGQARKRARKGLKPLETLSAEATRVAEDEVLALLRQGLAVTDGIVSVAPSELDKALALLATGEDDVLPF